MNEKPREVFLCPDCGGPSTATGDGNAYCEDCDQGFPLPKKITSKGPLPSHAGPLSHSVPKANSGAIQRNIVLKAKGAAIVPDSGKSEEPEDSLPVDVRSNFEDLKKDPARRRRKLKKRKKVPARVYAKWLAIWLLVVGVILFTVTQLQEVFSERKKDTVNIEERLVGEEYEFYHREYPQILSQFNGFLRARTASEMAEFTRDSNQLARKMNRYFGEQAPRRPTSGGLKPDPVFWNVAFEERPGFVEVVWDGKEKGLFEGVFVKKEDKWLLDWEQYVRYSSESWTLFRDNIGGQRNGIFRVFVEKIEEGEGENFEPWMKVKISPPVTDAQRRQLGESELIHLDGEKGLYTKFSSLFADLSGRSEGFSQLWKRDPRRLRRATVELEWLKDPESGEERMVIKSLLAENWRTLKADDEQLDSE